MPRRPRPPRRRLLAIGKWTGLALCIAIAGVWVYNGWRALHWVPFRSGPVVTLIHGEIKLGIREPAAAPNDVAGRLLIIPTSFLGSTSRWSWALPSVRAHSPTGRTPAVTTATCPLWCLFIVALTPTALLWYGSRPRPGHCRCGYSLAGNTSGVCPECGRASGPPTA